MTTLAEIEAAAQALPQDHKMSLFEWLAAHLRNQRFNKSTPHSVLDIAPVSLGRVICLPQSDDDLLGEMLGD